MRKVHFKEGGNMSMNGVSATKLRVGEMDDGIFDSFQTAFTAFLFDLNDAFKAQYKRSIWSDEAIENDQIYSGSSEHFFQKPHADYKKYKSVVGDFDIQVPEGLKPYLHEFLVNNKDKTFGSFTILQIKQPELGITDEDGIEAGFDAEQDHILLSAPGFPGGESIQIDFEYVPFHGGHPTEWSKFAHSSPWTDMEKGIKGAFHKILLKALIEWDEVDIPQLITDKGAPKTHRVNGSLVPTGSIRGKAHNFDVGHGMAGPSYVPADIGWNDKTLEKYPDLANVTPHVAKKTDELKYSTNLYNMFEAVFGRLPENKAEWRKFTSYLGLLDLIDENFDAYKIRSIFNYFYYLLYNGQSMSRFNKQEDQTWKADAVKPWFDRWPYLADNWDKGLSDAFERHYNTTKSQDPENFISKADRTDEEKEYAKAQGSFRSAHTRNYKKENPEPELFDDLIRHPGESMEDDSHARAAKRDHDAWERRKKADYNQKAKEAGFDYDEDEKPTVYSWENQ